MDENEKNLIEEEEIIDIDLGDESTFYVADNGNFFAIGFDKLFRKR